MNLKRVNWKTWAVMLFDSNLNLILLYFSLAFLCKFNLILSLNTDLRETFLEGNHVLLFLWFKTRDDVMATQFEERQRQVS